MTILRRVDALAEWGLNSAPWRRADAALRLPVFLAELTRKEAAGQAFFLAESARLAHPAVSPDLVEVSEAILRGGSHPLLASDPLDTLGRLHLERRFHRFIAERSGDGNLPPYYWRYLHAHDAEGRPTEIDLRYVGLLPHPSVVPWGVVAYLKGLSHGFEYDPENIEALVNAGLAVFTLDWMDHGLSSHQDCRVRAIGDPHSKTVQTAQFLNEIHAIMTRDSRLRHLPLFGIGVSKGALHLAAALAEIGPTHGMQAVYLDTPGFEVGEKPRGRLAVMESFMARFRDDPTLVAPFFYPRDIKPWDASTRMSRERREYLNRYHESRLGIRHGPPGNLLYFIEEPRLRRQIFERGLASHMPRLLMSLAPGDEWSENGTSVAFATVFGADRALLRVTRSHASFPDNAGLQDDVVRFFGNRQLGRGRRLFQGRRAISRFAVRTNIFEGAGPRKPDEWHDRFIQGRFGK